MLVEGRGDRRRGSRFRQGRFIDARVGVGAGRQGGPIRKEVSVR